MESLDSELIVAVVTFVLAFLQILQIIVGWIIWCETVVVKKNHEGLMRQLDHSTKNAVEELKREISIHEISRGANVSPIIDMRQRKSG